jgi:hypothetical protein
VPFRLFALAAAAVLTLTACTPAESEPDDPPKEEEPVSIERPAVGACRVLEPADIAKASDETEPVPCAKPHTAETFVVGRFADKLADAEYDDPELGAEVYETCQRAYMKFTGADQSLALRTVLSWAWFRPTEEEWDAGARWYRCDVVGGTDKSTELIELPRTAKGVLLGIPGDRWMACVKGPSVSAVPPVPCTEPHDWRAVTTIVVGKEDEKYPGDRLVEVLSRDYCSDSVGAWMNYPIDYEYAYTWFHRAEWETGNRRSVCWAGTDE